MKRNEIIVKRISGCNRETAGHSLRSLLAELLDALQTVPTVGARVFLVVLLAEFGEVAFKDSMKFIATTGNVPVRRHGRDTDCRAHINIYGRNKLPASRGG